MSETKKTKEWWELLDWSQMKMTFENLPKGRQEMLLEKGFWSKGKGIFAEIRKKRMKAKNEL